MVEFFIAKKHIFERKRQSIISILGIFIGVVVLTVSIGISNGLNKNMIDSILSVTCHINSSNGELIEDYEEIAKKIEGIKGVKGVVPTISSQGILKYKYKFDSGQYVSGIKIECYDIESAKKAIDLDKKIVAGDLENMEMNSIIIGKELFKMLGAEIGDTITIISSENKEIDFKIKAVFQSGYYDYDVNMVILPLSSGQYITYGEDVVTKLETTLFNPYKAPEISMEIMKETGIFSRSWGEMNRALLSALSLEKTVMILVFSLIVIIAGFVVWVTLNMLVREKIKDIGILRAMGFSKKNIVNIFLIQGLIFGVIGIIFGVICSLGILWYLKTYSLDFISSIYYLERIPIVISWKEIAVIVFANIVVVVLSSIFPAYRGAKLETVEALKYE